MAIYKMRELPDGSYSLTAYLDTPAGRVLVSQRHTQTRAEMKEHTQAVADVVELTRNRFNEAIRDARAQGRGGGPVT
jgi:hypothetical protein